MEKFYSFMVHPITVAVMTLGTILSAVVVADIIVNFLTHKG